jgi:hypothetical protein
MLVTEGTLFPMLGFIPKEGFTSLGFNEAPPIQFQIKNYILSNYMHFWLKL